jgi:tetratricopeptide (TPR) repeat protein
LSRLSANALAGFLLTLHVAAGEEESLVAQGERLLKEGAIPEAVETLRRAVQADPRSSLAYTRLGGAQVLNQDYAAGIESFKQAIGLDPNNADAFIGMAIAYIHGGRYPLARAALLEAERIDPAKKADIDELVAWIDRRMAQ